MKDNNAIKSHDIQVAIISSIGTILAAIVLAIVGPVIVQSLSPTPTKTVVLTLTSSPSLISTPTSQTATPLTTPSPTASVQRCTPFWSLSDSQALNPSLKWESGGSNNSYLLIPSIGSLLITAGARTDQWVRVNSAPLLLCPLVGDFDARVKIDFDPKQNFQAAGMGVRGQGENKSWVRIIKRFSDRKSISTETKQNEIASGTASSAYENSVVFFRIERRENSFTLSYGNNADSWNALEKSSQVEISHLAEIYLTVFSALSDQQVTARFSDFVVFLK